MKSKQTWKKVATLASKTLKSRIASKKAKELAWSALAQSNTEKETSPKVAKEAVKRLKDKLASIKEKSLAWSDLSQAKWKKKK